MLMNSQVAISDYTINYCLEYKYKIVINVCTEGEYI